MSPRLLRPIASGVHPEANAWRSAVVANGGTVSASTLTAVSKFCAAIDAAGIRDRFYRLNLFCGTGLSAALVPLYRGQSRTGTQFGGTTDTNSNFVSGDYVETGATGGIKGNGTNKRLDTGFAGSALSPGDRHVSAYDRINATTDYSPSVHSGTANATQHGIGPWTTAATYAYRTHNAVGANASATKNVGLWLGSDTSATASVLYRNGSSVASVSGQNAGGSGNNNYMILGIPAGEWSEAALGAYSIGLSMTAGQVSSYYTAMQEFQTALTRNV
jgi:hypothetical protein